MQGLCQAEQTKLIWHTVFPLVPNLPPLLPTLLLLSLLPPSGYPSSHALGRRTGMSSLSSSLSSLLCLPSLPNPSFPSHITYCWYTRQALWLHQAYRLEFLGISTFVPGLFVSGLLFFAVNVWILGIVIQDIGERADDGSGRERRDKSKGERKTD